MKNYIATYFYQDAEELNASYGNIFLPLEQRNKIYWKTVYTLFFTSIVNNVDKNVKYLLFTNVENFYYRKMIEELGVKIYDTLQLSQRNDGKWATVKFFFDVIEFINSNDDFEMDDAFILLDTDVVSLRDAGCLFRFMRESDNGVAYINGRPVNRDHVLHDISLAELENISQIEFQANSQIEEFIGGEFFAFEKSKIMKFSEKIKLLNSTKYSQILTTEEQILTLLHSVRPWRSYPESIFRVWSNLKHIRLPKKDLKYIFLHLPSEKEYALNKLFYALKCRDPKLMSSVELDKKIKKVFPYEKRVSIIIHKVAQKFLSWLPWC